MAGTHHGRGFGRTLVDAARQTARAQAHLRNLCNVFFLVQADNGVISFWHHTGFSEERASLKLADVRWLASFEHTAASRRESTALRERCAALATPGGGLAAVLDAATPGEVQVEVRGE